MRDRSFLFSVSFAILFCYLNIHPLLNRANMELMAEETMSCEMMCSNEEPEPEENDCGSDGCNPFLPCSIGYCCFLPENFIAYNAGIAALKEKQACQNDNRVKSALSECWHPPEVKF